MLPHTLPPSFSSSMTTRDLAASNFPRSGVLNGDLWYIDADDSTDGDQVSSSLTYSHYEREGLNICQKHECQVSASAEPPKPAHSLHHLCAQIQPTSEGDRGPGRALHVQRHGR